MILFTHAINLFPTYDESTNYVYFKDIYSDKFMTNFKLQIDQRLIWKV